MYFKSIVTPGALFSACALFSSLVNSGAMGDLKSHFKGHFLVQIGGYSALQGKAQNVYVSENLIGNRYTVTSHNQGSGVVGLGYLLDAPAFSKRFDLAYGINSYFLGQTSVHGYIVEENTFTNLSYDYKIRSIPLYFAAKSVIHTRNDDAYQIAVDLGMGPNFMSASRYKEMPLTSFTIPNNNFTDRNNVNFSVSAGLGLRFNNKANQIPLECGYRFFYLGQGRFKSNNNQIINNVTTGDNYANAVICSVII